MTNILLEKKGSIAVATINRPKALNALNSQVLEDLNELLDLVKADEAVSMGQPLANIIHPYESELTETLYAPVNGTVFFIHNEPLTYANTAVIKLV